MDRLDKLLYGDEYQKDVGLGIDVKVYDDIQDLERRMNNCHNFTPSAKYYASYCWEWKSRNKPTEIDIKIPKINPVFQKQWNPWDDLVWRTDHWEFNIDKVTKYDYQLRNSIENNANNQELLLNIYRVMLTRAKKGLGIWFKDEETKQHFKDVCLLEG